MIKGALVFATGLAVGTFYGLGYGSLIEKSKQTSNVYNNTTESKTP